MTDRVLYAEIDKLLPNGYEGGPELDDILSELAANNVEVLQEPRGERDQEFNKDESLSANELQELRAQVGDDLRLFGYIREVLTLPPTKKWHSPNASVAVLWTRWCHIQSTTPSLTVLRTMRSY
jgi:hypothetical protein